MNPKHTIGTINARDRSDMSAIAPITFGRIAPPIIAMTRKEDALFARCPRPKMPRAKMVGNEMRVRPDGVRNPRRRIIHVKIILGFDVGNIGKKEYDR
jgi:hypothetical protein